MQLSASLQLIVSRICCFTLRTFLKLPLMVSSENPPISSLSQRFVSLVSLILLIFLPPAPMIRPLNLFGIVMDVEHSSSKSGLIGWLNLHFWEVQLSLFLYSIMFLISR